VKQAQPRIETAAPARCGFVNAADFGFSPAASGIENAWALQAAVDGGGTIIVSQPGVYQMADTVYIGSDTSLVFGNGVVLKKVAEQGPFTHVLLNKGALTRTFDHNITVDGLHIVVNGVDVRKFLAYGLHGQLAFFYVKDLRIERFRCMDLGRAQYAIHVCTFEDVIINDVIIKGDKDGVHLGRGKRFTISNGVFQTFDDAVALNGQDYDVGNPEMGWIEDGVVEKCYDLDAEKTTGFFCRIVAGGWIDWWPGMAVQKSDTVVSAGRLYRVQADPDGMIYTSTTQPTHAQGSQVLDGITWGAGQTDVTYTAGVRNVVFRDIFLKKPRIGFSVHFSKDKYDRSYYPGAEIPVQEQLTFDNVRVLHDQPTPLLEINTPVDVITLINSSLRNNRIEFRSNDALPDYLKTRINMVGCVFNQKGTLELVTNSVANKEIAVKTSASTELHDDFTASVVPGNGRITVESDLTGLRS
jgi:hypothetical protein